MFVASRGSARRGKAGLAEAWRGKACRGGARLAMALAWCGGAR